MESQHQKSKGYRNLSQEKIASMNEITAIGSQVQAVIEKLQKHIAIQRYNCKFDARQQVHDLDEWDRLVERTKTDFQTGLMCLVR